MRKDLIHLCKATMYSLQGLKAMWPQTPFRHELILGIIELPLAWLLPELPLLWRAILTLVWLTMPALEIVNSAIEAIVDLVSPQRHPLAGLAKDLGSAAVFCAITANILAWVVTICYLCGVR